MQATKLYWMKLAFKLRYWLILEAGDVYGGIPSSHKTNASRLCRLMEM